MPNAVAAEQIHPDSIRFLREFLYRRTGIVLEGDKTYLFESRLGPVARQLGLGSINQLCALLKGGEANGVGRRVVEAMTTNETYFFRDPAHYDAIRTLLLPRLRNERRDSRRLRFWSAAASTGQEAYSLAMLLCEEGFSEWNIEILGTDISSQVIERARSGLYRQMEVNRGLPAAMLVKYFHRAGVEWQLNDRVRRMVRFETMDLRGSLSMVGPFDLVFCRNVLIYFDAETKAKILREIHGTLFRGGWLLLGGAEIALGAEMLFERESVGSAIVYAAR